MGRPASVSIFGVTSFNRPITAVCSWVCARASPRTLSVRLQMTRATVLMPVSRGECVLSKLSSCTLTSSNRQRSTGVHLCAASLGWRRCVTHAGTSPALIGDYSTLDVRHSITAFMLRVPFCQNHTSVFICWVKSLCWLDLWQRTNDWNQMRWLESDRRSN